MTVLGIADLFQPMVDGVMQHHVTPMPECWMWCRRHEQAAKVGEKCTASKKPVCLQEHGTWVSEGGEGTWKCVRDKGHRGRCSPHPDKPDFWDEADHMVGTTWNMEYALDSCVRIGPFMTEREAKRLGRDMIACPECKTALGYHPLGMEIEA